MRLTREETSGLRAKVKDAVGAGLESGQSPEFPPRAPTETEIDQAAHWAVGEMENFLARKKWNARTEREHLEGQINLLRAELESATAFRITRTNGTAIASRSDNGDWWVHHPAAGPQGFTIRSDREEALQVARDLTGA